MPALTMTYGGFRTGNLIDNGYMEKRILEASAGAYYQTRFFEFDSGNGWVGTFRNTTDHVVDGTYSTVFYITSTTDSGTDPWAEMVQRIPLDAGLQTAQLSLLHHLTGRIYLEAGLGCDVYAYIAIGARYEDETVDYKRVVPLGVLPTGSWLSIDQYMADLWDAWAGSISPHRLSDATDLVIRVYFTAGTSSGSTILAVDTLALTAEMEFDKYPSFPEEIERDRAGASVRLGDTSRTLLQTYQSNGRSKQAGVLHFRLISKAQRYLIEGCWCYAGQTFLIWIPAMITVYPTSINIRPRGKFRFVAANQNLLAGYNGDIPWDEY